MVETAKGRGGLTLTRRIVTFRRTGAAYRRGEEVHVLRLYEPDELDRQLVRAGFQTRALNTFGKYALPHGIRAFLAIRTGSPKGRPRVSGT